MDHFLKDFKIRAPKARRHITYIQTYKRGGPPRITSFVYSPPPADSVETSEPNYDNERRGTIRVIKHPTPLKI